MGARTTYALRWTKLRDRVLRTEIPPSRRLIWRCFTRETGRGRAGGFVGHRKANWHFGAPGARGPGCHCSLATRRPPGSWDWEDHTHPPRAGASPAASPLVTFINSPRAGRGATIHHAMSVCLPGCCRPALERRRLAFGKLNTS